MKCIVCDKCGKIIKDPKEMRPITCWRPMVKDEKFEREGDPNRQDIVWEKDLCIACAQEIEQSIVPPTPTPPTPAPSV